MSSLVYCFNLHKDVAVHSKSLNINAGRFLKDDIREAIVQKYDEKIMKI